MADPTEMLAGVGGDVGEGVGALIGEAIAQGDYEEAERLRKEAMAEYGIDIPPVREFAARQQQSQAAGAQGSPEAKAARMEALRQLSMRGDEGYNAEDKAAISDTLADVSRAERGGREAILRKLPANSGARTAALLSNQQAGAQRANQQGLEIAAGSRRQALQALAGQGQLAGDIDTSEFGQAFGRGQAGDAMSRFNEQNRFDAARFNSQQQQQQFGAKLGLANARAGQYGLQAEDKYGAAERKKRAAAAGGRAIGTAGGAAVPFFV